MAPRRCCYACAYEPPWFHRTQSTFSRSPQGASITRNGAVSIPFRRETEIGQPAPGASHSENLAHLLIREGEVEDVDIFRQPLDLRGPRYRRNILLHQPAQADLGGGLAVSLPDPRQRLVVLDTASRDRTIGDQSHAVSRARFPHLGLVEIGMILDLIAHQ